LKVAKERKRKAQREAVEAEAALKEIQSKAAVGGSGAGKARKSKGGEIDVS
jgi:hypothetical protein